MPKITAHCSKLESDRSNGYIQASLTESWRGLGENDDLREVGGEYAALKGYIKCVESGGRRFSCPERTRPLAKEVMRERCPSAIGANRGCITEEGRCKPLAKRRARLPHTPTIMVKVLNMSSKFSSIIRGFDESLGSSESGGRLPHWDCDRRILFSFHPLLIFFSSIIFFLSIPLPSHSPYYVSVSLQYLFVR